MSRLRGRIVAVALAPLLTACSLSGGAGARSEPAAKVAPTFGATPSPGTHKPAAKNQASALHLIRALADVKGRAGIAVLFSDGSVATAGSQQVGNAWSTSKVPVIIAALKRSMSSVNLAWAFNAITESDNASAQTLWGTLGRGTVAAKATDEVLRELNDAHTRTNPFVTREGYTAFGQTQWSLTNQTRVAASLACSPTAAEAKVFALMGQVESSESWGLGTWPGAHFKGGWGPGTDGRYLVRQFGALPLKGGWVPVAIAVIPASGSFADATADLDRMTSWLWNHRTDLQPLHCEQGH